MLAERFRNLVLSIQRHGARSGLALKLTNDPDKDNIPLVFDVAHAETEKVFAVLIAFPPTEPFFNSDVISFVVREMRRAESIEAMPVLLFLDQNLPQVERTLTYAGLAQRATTLCYTRTKHGYEMDWVIAEPSAKT